MQIGRPRTLRELREEPIIEYEYENVVFHFPGALGRPGKSGDLSVSRWFRRPKKSEHIKKSSEKHPESSCRAAKTTNQNA
jgi:hypothetical protein